MKNKIFFLMTALIVSFIFVAPAMAGDYGLTDVGTGAGYKNNDIYTAIALTVNIVLSLLAIIFFAVMMYGGVRWMTARGKDELTEKAKNAITAGIIGLIIIVISYSLSAFVLSKLGGGEAPTRNCLDYGGTQCVKKGDCTGTNKSPMSFSGCPSSYECCAITY